MAVNPVVSRNMLEERMELVRTQGSATAAAKSLGLHRTTLHGYFKRHGIDLVQLEIYYVQTKTQSTERE